MLSNSHDPRFDATATYPVSKPSLASATHTIGLSSNKYRQLRNGKTSLLSVAHTTSPNIFIETTYIGEGDPGYWHTCHLLAECALSLVLPPPEGTHLPPLGRRGGCLTPSTALGGVLVQRLRDSGKVKMESRLIMLDEGKKRR